MPAKAPPKPGKGAFYAKVDQKFYDQIKKENGGKLPANLIGPNGKPRKLTSSKADRAYRKKWLAIAAKERNSKAVPNKEVEGICIPCMLKALAAKIPPIVMPSKKDGKPAKLQPPPKPQPKPKRKHEKQKTVPCKNETLIIKCDHAGERAFHLELPPKEDEEETGAVLEVIDNGKEKITCSTKIVGGPCGSIHQNKVFDISPDDTVKERSDSQVVFRAEYDEDLDNGSFWDLFHPEKQRAPTRYTIRTQTCQQEESLSATIWVYPQLDWEIGVTLGWQPRKKLDGPDDSDEPDQKDKITFGGSVALTHCGKKREFANEFAAGLKRYLKWAEMAYDTADFLTYVAGKAGSVKLSFTYPTISLKGKWGWQEIEDSYRCGYGTKWELGFSPLVGAAIQTDVVDALIKAATVEVPPLGVALSRIKEAIEHAGGKAGIILRAEGKLDGSFSYAKVKTESIGDGAGKLGGKVIFTIEGIVKSKKFSFWCFHAGGEAKIGAHASLSAKVTGGADAEGWYYKGYFGFDGLLVYVVVAGGVNISFESPPEEEEFEADKTDIEDAPSSQVGVEAKEEPQKKEGKGGIKYQWNWAWIPEWAHIGGEEKHRFSHEEED